MSIRKSVLLVEDHPAFSKLVALMLESNQYHVLAADSGESALAISKSHPGPIHLLLTDVMMPDITGRELAAVICEVRKETRVVFMSGYPRETVLEKGICHEKMFFLQKPFSMQVMLGMIDSVLKMSSSELKVADHG